MPDSDPSGGPNADLQSWEIVALQKVKSEVIKAHNSGKYLFVWDRNGSVATFFKYAASICYFDEEV